MQSEICFSTTLKTVSISTCDGQNCVCIKDENVEISEDEVTLNFPLAVPEDHYYNLTATLIYSSGQTFESDSIYLSEIVHTCI